MSACTAASNVARLDQDTFVVTEGVQEHPNVDYVLPRVLPPEWSGSVAMHTGCLQGSKPSGNGLTTETAGQSMAPVDPCIAALRGNVSWR